MKCLFILLILQGLLILAIQSAFANYVEPDVERNVHILQNATPTACQAASNGSSGPQDVTSDTRYGAYNGTTGAGIRSCSDCAVDPTSGDCVCRICYYYFN